MIWIKSNYNSCPSIMIDTVATMDELYQEIKNKTGVPIYLQRLEYSTREITEKTLEELNKNEINNVYLNVRYFNVELNFLIKQIVLNGSDFVPVNTYPVLVKEKYYKPLYCINEENLVQFIFNSIHYNNQEIYPILKTNTKILVRTKQGTFQPDYFIDTFGKNGISIISVPTKYFKGLCSIKIINLGINTDPELDKNLSFHILVSNKCCVKCGTELENKYVLIGKSGSYYHLDCVK
jgi:hypothetical protein